MSNRKRKNSEEFEPENRHKQGNIESENAPSEDKLTKTTKVLLREFNKEIELRMKEIEQIEERLYEVLRIQHLLRFAVITSYYGARTSQGDWSINVSGKHLLHPAVAGLMRKTRPDNFKRWALGEVSLIDMDEPLDKGMAGVDPTLPTKVPRYIPPVSKSEPKAATSPTRGSHVKINQRIIVGNVSRRIPSCEREDQATHKWMVYARGPNNAVNLSHVVEKVRFFLHESYRPFDVVEIKSSPFRVSRHGWGEFPIRVQLHFHNPLNRPIDIIHNLTLERSQTTKEALGSETIVEVWLHVDEEQKGCDFSETVENEENDETLEVDSQDNQVKFKTEIKEEEESDVSEKSLSDCETEIVEPEIVEPEIKIEKAIKEEIVIEDGYFDMSYDNYAVKDITVATEGFSVKNKCSSSVLPQYCDEQQRITEFTSYSISRNLENSGPPVLPLQSGLSGASISSGNSKVLGCFGPTASSSNIKQGLVKGTSLLVKSSNMPSGTSLLLRNPTTSKATGTLPTSKPPVDPKLAFYKHGMSNLSKRLHTDQVAATRHLLNFLPIVTSKASDPAYRTVHPYAAESVTAFLNWPVAKRRASEWMRALVVRKILTTQGFSEEEEGAWTIKDIMQWARLWGYTSLEQHISFPCFCKPEGGNNNCEEAPPRISIPASTFSEAKEVNQWLSSLENEKVRSRDENNGEEVDVVETESDRKRSLAGSSKEMGLGARAAVSRKVIVLGMDSSLDMISRYIEETTREIGIVVSTPEEVIPCVFYSAAQRLLIESLKSFMNDLIRNSLCFAFRRTPINPEVPLIIKAEDVELAVLNRRQFDLLTNEGLGAESNPFNWDT